MKEEGIALFFLYGKAEQLYCVLEEGDKVDIKVC